MELNGCAGSTEHLLGTYLIALEKKIFHFTICIKIQYELPHEISNNVVCATIKALDQPAHMRSLIRVFASRLNIL